MSWFLREFETFDGRTVGYRTFAPEGEARRTVLVLHGFLADGNMNWIAPGVAEAMVAAGLSLVLPDFRGHGLSRDVPPPYPPDALPMDQEALIAHLGLTDYDLAGYSLGARTAIRLLARGARPRKAFLGGIGLLGIVRWEDRAADFREWIRDGEAGTNPRAGRAVRALMGQSHTGAEAALAVLDSQVATTVEELAAIPTPCLVVSGDKDDDNGSAEELAAALPNASALRVPGHHLSASGSPEYARAIVDWFSAP